MKKRIELSVHDIVDLLLRRGDIDNRIYNQGTMEEGTKIHCAYQKNQGDEYEAEYYLAYSFDIGDFTLDIQGRADGVIKDNYGNVIIDEIKSTNIDVEKFNEEQNDWHMGQVQLYAYMYMLLNSITSISVQLTYISQLDSTHIVQILHKYSFDEIKSICDGYLNQYVNYLTSIKKRREIRQTSLTSLSFPFDSVRKGQQEMMEFVSSNIDMQNVCYIEAKTGIGKTISTLYPAVKKLGEKDLDKIFYLTSKNSIKNIAKRTLVILNKSGAKVKTIVLSSKEMMCINDIKRHCNPDECQYAKNYYDKINEIINRFINMYDIFDIDNILEFAKENQICPFEFQLDLSNYVDVIVGDYNYLFDPHAKLIRYFENCSKKPFLLLIDEGHNLPSRVRDMYSDKLSLFEIIDLYKEIKENYKPLKGFTKKIANNLLDIISFFDSIECEEFDSKWENVKEEKGLPLALNDILTAFIKLIDKKNKDNIIDNDKLLDLFYKVINMLSLPEDDEKYVYYYTFDQNNECVGFSINCIDSRNIIKKEFNNFYASVIFSATLTPRDYFLDLLGGNKDSQALYLPSPFKEENRLVIVNSFISTYYKDRDISVGKIFNNILAIISSKVGNYFVFFPSYEYMIKFKTYFDAFPMYECIYQNSSMSEEERNEFLLKFKKNPTRTTIGFIVLGGIFAEGIDLVEDRLIGAIIVSVGLQRMSFINDKIKDYFSKDGLDTGFSYAYNYPGLNKVLQAAGRVIRTETDKGVICFIDTRYANTIYKNCLEEMYNNYEAIGNTRLIANKVKEFWSK